MFRVLSLFYILLIIYSLYCYKEVVSPTNPSSWWGNEVSVSDWRTGVKCNYATNVAVDWWYNGRGSKQFRSTMGQEADARLLHGDTLLIAVDYYILFNIVQFPEILKRKFYKEFLGGRVIVFRVTVENGGYLWRAYDIPADYGKEEHQPIIFN